MKTRVTVLTLLVVLGGAVLLVTPRTVVRQSSTSRTPLRPVADQSTPLEPTLDTSGPAGLKTPALAHQRDRLRLEMSHADPRRQEWSVPLEPAVQSQTGRVRLEVFAHDGRRLAGYQVIVLGDQRVMKDFEPDESAARPGTVELDVVGKAQRILVIPYDPDLAVAVIDVDVDAATLEPATIFLEQGREIVGEVVDARGEPIPGESVSVVIGLPHDPRHRDTSFAHRWGNNVEYWLDEEGLRMTTSTNTNGRLKLANLPLSGSKLIVTLLQKDIEQDVTEPSTRIVLPEPAEK